MIHVGAEFYITSSAAPTWDVTKLGEQPLGLEMQQQQQRGQQQQQRCNELRSADAAPLSPMLNDLDRSGHHEGVNDRLVVAWSQGYVGASSAVHRHTLYGTVKQDSLPQPIQLMQAPGVPMHTLAPVLTSVRDDPW